MNVTFKTFGEKPVLNNRLKISDETMHKGELSLDILHERDNNPGAQTDCEPHNPGLIWPIQRASLSHYLGLAVSSYPTTKPAASSTV